MIAAMRTTCQIAQLGMGAIMRGEGAGGKTDAYRYRQSQSGQIVDLESGDHRCTPDTNAPKRPANATKGFRNPDRRPVVNSIRGVV
jgi:hypothetical protein